MNAATIADDLRGLLRPFNPAESRALIEYQADVEAEAAARAWEVGDIDAHLAHRRNADMWGTALESLGEVAA